MSIILTVDIAHPPMDREEANNFLSYTFLKVKNSKTLRVIKIIHGYGSKGEGGILKTETLNWAYLNREKICQFFSGEELSLNNENFQSMCIECKISLKNFSDSINKGTSIVWVK